MNSSALSHRDHSILPNQLGWVGKLSCHNIIFVCFFSRIDYRVGGRVPTRLKSWLHTVEWKKSATLKKMPAPTEHFFDTLHVIYFRHDKVDFGILKLKLL